LRALPSFPTRRSSDLIGHTFHAVAGGNIMTVVPDNAGKRKEYEQQVVKTIFLSNADPKAAADLLRIALGARRVAAVPDANAVTRSEEHTSELQSLRHL